MLGYAAHNGTLGFIPVSPAAEHRNKPVLFALAEGGKYVFKSIGRVGVVYYNMEISTRGHCFRPALNAVHFG